MAKGVSGTPSEVDTSVKKPEIKLPPGYESESAFLEEMRDIYYDNDTFAKDNNIAASEDLTFATGEQWDWEVKERRDVAHKPVLTFNRLPAFVAQVVGSRRLNETEIHIHAEDDQFTKEATLREDVFRALQRSTNAKLAFDNALMGNVTCGIANFQVSLDYAADDVFDQNIDIKPVMSHTGVLWDYQRLEPTGKDATNCFVIDSMGVNLFYQKYPWATPADIIPGNAINSYYSSGWLFEGNVRVVDYWRMRTERRTLMMRESNGQVVDVTNTPKTDMLWKDLAVNSRTNEPMLREVDRKFAQKYICSGTDILAGPYNLPIDRIPVFRVPGWEMWIEEKLHTWGLVRFMKDPQVLHNYWRSVIAERLMASARPGWMASKSAVAGRENSWRNAHLRDDPLLIYNDDAAQPPMPVPPAQFEQAFAAQAEMTNQDLKDISNIHEANLGMPSNEVSGVALMARQRISDTGTIIYHDNLTSAQLEAARVINDLISFTFTTRRKLKAVGPTGAERMQQINAGDNPNSIDITMSKYTLTAKTGPSYETKRIEAADNMQSLANAMPNILAVAADKIVEAQDWPGAQEIAERIRMTMPPFLLSQADMTPAVQHAQQMQLQGGQQKDQMTQAMATAKYFQTMASAEMSHARAQHYATQTAGFPSQIANQSMTAMSEARAREAASAAKLMKG